MKNMIMNDIITNIGNCVVQHGKYNDRIYLMKLSKNDCPSIIYSLDELALKEGYSKIFAKVPESEREKFIENGYVEEAHIPQFFNGYEDVYFLGDFLDKSRNHDELLEKTKKVLDIARSRAIENNIFCLPHEFSYKICNRTDTDKMAELYKKVFETYPFPIHDPDYILKTMEMDFIYFSIWKNDKIIALSSSEMDVGAQNAEMTDFATLPEYQGNGFAIYLLNKMEDEMRKRKIKTCYTISRAISCGINIIFAKMEYLYGGTLINNTNISGKLESMNVWYKFL